MEPKETNIDGRAAQSEDLDAEVAAAEEQEAKAGEDEEKKQGGKKEGKNKGKEKESQEEKFQELGERLQEKEKQYLQLYADFENYRKHTNREKMELTLSGGKDVIKALLPVIDDLERALAAMPAEEPLREGVQLICNKMLKTLEQKGLKPMEAKGEKFDENLHEAITRIPAVDEQQKGMVVDVVEKGYFLNDKVLRFAKVVVAF